MNGSGVTVPALYSVSFPALYLIPPDVKYRAGTVTPSVGEHDKVGIVVREADDSPRRKRIQMGTARDGTFLTAFSSTRTESTSGVPGCPKVLRMI
jgi:hypothetical protein